MIVIRADATERIGTGHLMRCLALAQAWQDVRGNATFLTTTPAPAHVNRLTREGMAVVSFAGVPGSAEDAGATIEMARELNATAVVVDGYHFGAEFQDRVKAAGLSLLFIDDNAHADHYFADWVLNQNNTADAAMYPRRASHTSLLLGPSFALLRREFNGSRNRKKEIPRIARRVLVTLGGSDCDNVTLQVIHALGRMTRPDLEAIVVAGASNPHLDSLRTAIAASPVEIRLAINVTNMPELMAWADVAVAAGGSTCWELAMLGLPACLLVLADNQEASAARLHEDGVFITLGRAVEYDIELLAAAVDSLLEDQPLRQLLSDRGQRLVDGFGAERVAAAIRGCQPPSKSIDELQRTCEI